MKKSLITLVTMLVISGSALAQKPKLYLKAYGGLHVKSFIYKLPDQETADVLAGWQGGFGFRVSYRKVFGELDTEFIRSQFSVLLETTDGQEEILLKSNSLNIPMKAGFIPVKGAFFKWYLYSGISTRINTKARIFFRDEEIPIKPSELGLRSVNVDWLLGTQFDVGWLNIDLYYGLGVTNSGNQGVRTNSNEILLNLGFLF